MTREKDILRASKIITTAKIIAEEDSISIPEAINVLKILRLENLEWSLITLQREVMEVSNSIGHSK